MECEISNGNGITTYVWRDHIDFSSMERRVTVPLGPVAVIVYVEYPAPVKASVDKDTDKWESKEVC